MLLEDWLSLMMSLKNREDVRKASQEQTFHSYETLEGILSQSDTRRLTSLYYLVRIYGKEFLQRYDNGQSICDIAKWINLSPITVARKVLELRIKQNKKMITKMLRYPLLISEKRLSEEVRACIEADEYSGPRADRARHVTGMEYEQRLTDEVQSFGIEFESEQELRDRGCYKTPDLLLRVPVSVGGKVVWWIDSKAKFGDAYTQTNDYVSVGSYVGRYGPGMVIYWFGFIEDCETPMTTDCGVLVVDEFPRSVETLPGTCIDASF